MNVEKTLKSVVITLLVTSLGLSQSVRESFDYAPAALDGLGETVDGWEGPWTIFEGSSVLMNIEEGSLEFPGVPTSGNFLMGTMSTTDDAQRAYRELESVWLDDGIPYWISYLMEINNSSFIDDSWQGVSLYLNDGTELALFGKVWGLPNLGLMAHTLGSATTTSELTWEEGLIWTVIRIDMSGDDQNEKCHMWFNPDPAAEPDTANADVKADLLLNDGFERIVVHFGKFIDLETCFDEIRLGTSFEDVSSAYTTVKQHENQRANQFELSNNYPNPFNPQTQINYQIPQTANVNIAVYNLSGRLVTTLVNAVKSPGSYSVSWNATDQNGLPVAGGIYIARMVSKNYSASRKLTLIR